MFEEKNDVKAVEDEYLAIIHSVEKDANQIFVNSFRHIYKLNKTWMLTKNTPSRILVESSKLIASGGHLMENLNGSLNNDAKLLGECLGYVLVAVEFGIANKLLSTEDMDALDARVKELHLVYSWSHHIQEALVKEGHGVKVPFIKNRIAKIAGQGYLSDQQKKILVRIAAIFS